jgi:hypothetical protein
VANASAERRPKIARDAIVATIIAGLVMIAPRPNSAPFPSCASSAKDWRTISRS